MREIKDTETDVSGSANFSLTYYFDGDQNRLSVDGFMVLGTDGVLTTVIISEAKTVLVGLLDNMKARYGA